MAEDMISIKNDKVAIILLFIKRILSIIIIITTERVSDKNILSPIFKIDSNTIINAENKINRVKYLNLLLVWKYPSTNMKINKGVANLPK